MPKYSLLVDPLAAISPPLLAPQENYPHFSRVIYRTGRKIRRRGLSRPLYMLLCVRIMTRKVYDSRYSMYLPPGTLLSEDTLLRRR